MTPRRLAPLLVASLVLGVGLGGFIDGIVLHQLLQWHSMLAWAATLLGVVLLFRAGRFVHNVWSGRVLAGGMIAGWGLFNLLEGLIDHQILGLHHVRPGEHQLAWDLGFLLGGGLGLIVLGALLVRGARDLTWGTAAPASLPVLVIANSAPTGTR